MSKAILVLPEMYEQCADCDLCVLDEDEGKHFCAAPTGDWILDISKRADFCPLRPMPERKTPCQYDTHSVGYAQGWNDCLRAIEWSGEKT